MQQSRIKRLINTENVMSSQATHVVVGIDWGSYNILSVMNSEEDSQDANDLKVGL